MLTFEALCQDSVLSLRFSALAAGHREKNMDSGVGKAFGVLSSLLHGLSDPGQITQLMQTQHERFGTKDDVQPQHLEARTGGCRGHLGV